ncbi:MAG TPA: SIS domain-containing protein [Candidatus Limnocylindrales bacterium]
MTSTLATLPLKPLKTDRRAGVARALAARPEIEAFAAEVVAAGLRNVFLVGSGGGLITHAGLQYDLERHSTRLPVFAVSANEFIHRHPALLGAGSLVLLASNTGTTPEVVAAARFAKDQGATVASFTKLAESPLAAASDRAWTYGDDSGIGDPKQFALALLGNALLRETGDLVPAEYAARTATLEALPAALVEAVQETEDRNRAIAEALKDEPIIYILGGGPNWATAYCLAMCYLQEMQWKHAASFDAAEFLHGAMEVVVDDTAVIQFLGEEATRPIDERAKAFLEKYTSRGFYVDAKELTLSGIEAAQRPYVSHFALMAVMSRLAEHFEAATGHDLHIRRYMFRVDY